MTQPLPGSWGYSPDIGRVTSLDLGPAPRVLAVGAVPSDLGLHTSFRFARGHEDSLPKGVFWELGSETQRILVVIDGIAELGFEQATPAQRILDALDWLEYWWAEAEPYPAPSFTRDDQCIHVPTNTTVMIHSRLPRDARWSYHVFLQGSLQTVSEGTLRQSRSSVHLKNWANMPPLKASELGVILTHTKIKNGLTDTLFSYGASKTIFRAYQFKPILKYLDSHAERILIADEVGLGKTISAGLLWTELKARRLADRTLVICPASLVDKWINEMDERFNLALEELSKERLETLMSDIDSGRGPISFSYICSLERLRSYKSLQGPEAIPLDLDLTIIDEAHQLRNPETASYQLGARVSDWTRSLIMLSATPLNLGRRDLLSLTRMLLPSEIQRQEDLEQRLDHHPALNRLRRSLLDANTTNEDRRHLLHEVRRSSLGAAIAMRPAYGEIEKILSKPHLEVSEIPQIRDACAALEGLSAVLTRTRKADVNEQKPIRQLIQIAVPWTDAERNFYDEYQQWARDVCREYELPTGFAMQMPLRLAGSCLAAALDGLRSATDDEPDYGRFDFETDHSSVFRAAQPSAALRQAGARLRETDTKLQALTDRLRKVRQSGRRALLFTFSRRTLAYLQEKLASEFRVGVLHGGVSREDRKHVMCLFRDHHYDILLATRVASEGLDFEFCSIVINYDLPWNPMEVEQRIGRIDRIGQTEQKIQIWNFATEGTIETRIIDRLLDRIGIFEESIGELEPIIADRFIRAIKASLDLTLTPDESESELLRAEIAISQNRIDRARLEAESPWLQAHDQFGIQEVEQRIARGRYLSGHELQRMLAAWANRNGGWARLDAGGTSLEINLSTSMLTSLASWAHKTAQTSPLVRAIQQQSSRGPVRLYLDSSVARQVGGTLVNTNHPLVQTALDDDAARDGRFSRLRIYTDQLGSGTYLVLFGHATWTGLRSTREIWSVAYDLTRQHLTKTDVGAEVLANLTKGDVHDTTLQHGALDTELQILEDALEQRRRDEEGRQQVANTALIEERRLRSNASAERRLADLKNRREKSPQMHHAFDGQIRRAKARQDEEIAQIEAASACGMSVTPIALCLVEVV